MRAAGRLGTANSSANHVPYQTMKIVQLGREIMRLKQLSLLASASLFGMLVHAGLSTSALAQAAAALTVTVTSAEEGPMECVLVTAKKDGSTIAVTVVTDAKGQYSFPADRLTAGHYAI